MSTSSSPELPILLESLRRILPNNQIDWREIRGGIAMSFSDGLDALFITQASIRDVMPKDCSAYSADSLVEEFHRLDSGRKKVLVGLRHYAKERNAAILRSADGKWSLNAGWASGEIDVGPPLTRLLHTLSPAESLRILVKQSCLLRAPSPKRADRLTSYPTPPDAELDWDTLLRQEPTLSPKALAIDCTALDRDDIDFDNQDKLCDALMPYRDDSGIKVLEIMVERIGKKRFSVDMFDKGAGFFEFTDELANFRIHPRGRRMRQLIQDAGIKGAAHKLVVEFEFLDRARTRCLGAIETILHRAGFVRHLGASEEGWVLGRNSRELSFDPFDGLTRDIRNKGELELIMQWLESAHAVLPIPSREELSLILEGPYEKIDERSLPASAEDSRPLIARFDSLDLRASNKTS